MEIATATITGEYETALAVNEGLQQKVKAQALDLTMKDEEIAGNTRMIHYQNERIAALQAEKYLWEIERADLNKALEIACSKGNTKAEDVLREMRINRELRTTNETLEGIIHGLRADLDAARRANAGQRNPA